jgi:hypothetical protein
MTNPTTDTLLAETRRTMERIGFVTAAHNLMLNWPGYSLAQRVRVARMWGVEISA